MPDAGGRIYQRGTSLCLNCRSDGRGTTFHFTRYGATATIKVFTGTKPADVAGAFDAREVLRYLGPGVRR